MKIEITNDVRDKETGEFHKKGDVIERDKARAQKFIAAGYGKEVKSSSKSKSSKTAKTTKADTPKNKQADTSDVKTTDTKSSAKASSDSAKSTATADKKSK